MAPKRTVPLLAVGLAILVVACGSRGGGTTAATPEPKTGAEPPGFASDAATQSIELPLDGHLAGEVRLTTEQGVRLILAAGTAIRTPTGAALTGSFTLVLDDGGPDADRVARELGNASDGTVRVGFLAPGAGGPVFVDAVFDPPGARESERASPRRAHVGGNADVGPDAGRIRESVRGPSGGGPRPVVGTVQVPVTGQAIRRGCRGRRGRLD